jgi:hypothetical protein
MDDTGPADFYTGIVVDVYGPLRGSVPDPRTYAAFVNRWGEPALELGIEVTVHHSTIERMDLGRTYRSIFLAGPTFNLIADDATAVRALERIGAHLDPGGAALVPLFIPEPVPERHLGFVREHVDEVGRILRVSATSTERDDESRRQVTTLRYEVIDGPVVQVVERPWILHSEDCLTEIGGGGDQITAWQMDTGEVHRSTRQPVPEHRRGFAQCVGERWLGEFAA